MKLKGLSQSLIAPLERFIDRSSASLLTHPLNEPTCAFKKTKLYFSNGLLNSYADAVVASIAVRDLFLEQTSLPEDADLHCAINEAEVSVAYNRDFIYFPRLYSLLLEHKAQKDGSLWAYMNGSEISSRIQLVSVATPTSTLENEAPYTTLTGDWVIYAVRKSMRANFTNEKSTSLGHYFLDDYLWGWPSGLKIINDIKNAVRRLNQEL